VTVPSRARRLFAGWSANLVQIILGVTQQVALVPVFLHYWTSDLLAAWLAIYAAGNLILIADAGLKFRVINRFLGFKSSVDCDGRTACFYPAMQNGRNWRSSFLSDRWVRLMVNDITGLRSARSRRLLSFCCSGFVRDTGRYYSPISGLSLALSQSGRAPPQSSDAIWVYSKKGPARKRSAVLIFG
jgi:hypothetical protein